MKNKALGFYLSALALLSAMLGLVFYVITMNRQQNMIEIVVVVTLVGVTAGAVTCLLKDYLRLLTILSAAMYLLAGLLFLATQAENIGYAITDTRIGDGILPTFIAGMVLYGAAAVIGTIAACVRQDKL